MSTATPTNNNATSQSPSQPTTEQEATRSAPDLFTAALTHLPKDKPLVFTNLLRFRPQATYATPPPPNQTPLPSCTGSEAYWTRYFPIYHRACIETLGSESETLQRVLYKGSPLMPLRLSPQGHGGDEGYWHAVVMTRCESWDVVERIGRSEEYRSVAGWHREAAVEDDALFVSCPVDGFEMMMLN